MTLNPVYTQRHFTKVDYVALDLRHLNTQNRQIVMNYMTSNEVSNAQRNRTIIIGGQ